MSQSCRWAHLSRILARRSESKRKWWQIIHVKLLCEQAKFAKKWIKVKLCAGESKQHSQCVESELLANRKIITHVSCVRAAIPKSIPLITKIKCNEITIFPVARSIHRLITTVRANKQNTNIWWRTSWKCEMHESSRAILARPRHHCKVVKCCLCASERTLAFEAN